MLCTNTLGFEYSKWSKIIHKLDAKIQLVFFIMFIFWYVLYYIKQKIELTVKFKHEILILQ